MSTPFSFPYFIGIAVDSNRRLTREFYLALSNALAQVSQQNQDVSDASASIADIEQQIADLQVQVGQRGITVWGAIGGSISNQPDLESALTNLQNAIDSLATVVATKLTHPQVMARVSLGA